MSDKADLLTRIEAWLETPAETDATATLLIDLADFVERTDQPIPPAVIVLPMRSKLQRRALEIITENPGITLSALWGRVGGPDSLLYRAVKELERRQLVVVDRTPKTLFRAYPVKEAP